MPPKEKGSQEKKSKWKVVVPIVPITAAWHFPIALPRTDVATRPVGSSLADKWAADIVQWTMSLTAA